MSDQLSFLIRAGNPLIEIETTDERRAREVVMDVAQTLMRPLFEWTVTQGLSCNDKSVNLSSSSEPTRPAEEVRAVLNFAEQFPERAIFMFHDLGPHGNDLWVRRKLRDLHAQFSERRSTMILVEGNPLPPEIGRLSVRHEIRLPTPDELEQIIRETFKQIQSESIVSVSSNITRSTLNQMVQTLRGLNHWEAQRAINAAIHDDYVLNIDDIPRIVEAKRRLIGTGCLEPIAADFSVDDIGGLNNLKKWLKLRRDGFSADAQEFGLEPPRGVLMLGVQGCGKSLCAKVVAADWKMPLLRLDPGVLYQKFIGESESQLRQALHQAEAMAPVVLWIDEIEKAFASAAAASSDGGLSKRMFGTLLAWMQDHRHPIFIIATANDVSALPPELLRKGRFDEIFFVDLPNVEAREVILAIHLNRRKRKSTNFDLRKVANAADGFSGAELEQLVIASLYSAYDKNQPLTDANLLAEVEKTKPLSIIAAERLADLRNWARNRCVPAD